MSSAFYLAVVLDDLILVLVENFKGGKDQHHPHIVLSEQ